MASYLAQNAAMTRKVVSQPTNSDTKRRKRTPPIAEQRKERLQEKREVTIERPVTKNHPFVRNIAKTIPGTRRKRKFLRFVKNIVNKLKAAPVAGLATFAFAPLWGVQFCFALMAAVTSYFVDSSLIGAAADFFFPLTDMVLYMKAIVVIIGIIAVMLGFIALIGTFRNPFQGPLLLFFLSALCFYIACFNWPLLAIIPMLWIWLWLAAVFA